MAPKRTLKAANLTSWVSTISIDTGPPPLEPASWTDVGIQLASGFYRIQEPEFILIRRGSGGFGKELARLNRKAFLI